MAWHKSARLFMILSLICGITAVLSELGILDSTLLFSIPMNLFACIFLYLFVKYNPDPLSDRSKKLMLVYLLILYGTLLLSLMFLNDLFLRNKIYSGNYSDYNSRNLNLIPFRTILLYINGTMQGDLRFSQLAINLLGNFVAMMPLALLLPELFPSMRKNVRFVLVMSILIIFLEIMQYLLKTGVCDVDDLILNLSGAYLLFLLVKKHKRRKKQGA